MGFVNKEDYREVDRREVSPNPLIPYLFTVTAGTGTVLAATGTAGTFLAQQLSFAYPVFQHRLERLGCCFKMHTEIVYRNNIPVLQILFQFKKRHYGFCFFRGVLYSTCGSIFWNTPAVFHLVKFVQIVFP